MDSREKIMQAGDKNPCQAMISALFNDEYADAWFQLNKLCESIFQEAYQNALKEQCYEHLREKYCRVEFLNAFAWYSTPCHIIEFRFKGYPAEEAEWEENGLDNIYSRGPVTDTFKMYEYELVDYIK